MDRFLFAHFSFYFSGVWGRRGRQMGLVGHLEPHMCMAFAGGLDTGVAGQLSDQFLRRGPELSVTSDASFTPFPDSCRSLAASTPSHPASSHSPHPHITSLVKMIP